MGWLASLLLGLPGIADKLLDYLGKRTDAAVQTHTGDVAADVSVNVAVVQAAMADKASGRAQYLADRGSVWTCWMMPVAFLLCMYHMAWVVADSCPQFGHVVGSFNVSALPGAFATTEMSIILAAAGLVTAKAVIGKIFSK